MLYAVTVVLTIIIIILLVLPHLVYGILNLVDGMLYIGFSIISKMFGLMILILTVLVLFYIFKFMVKKVNARK